MTKAEKYIKNRPEYNFFLVNKKFGNGKQLIEFFYRAQFCLCNQGFIAYVDNQRWKKDRHGEMDLVEKYLIENEGNGEFDIDDFLEYYNEEIYEGNTNLSYEDFYDERFELWLKEQFPKIDITCGGVSYFNSVK
jgi:hypothetical protein